MAENTLRRWPEGYSLTSSTLVTLHRTVELTEIELGCLLEHQPMPRESSVTTLSLYACPGDICSYQKTLKYKCLEMSECISTGRNTTPVRAAWTRERALRGDDVGLIEVHTQEVVAVDQDSEEGCEG